MLTGTLRQARRVIVAIVGFTLVLIGIAMFITPGPGWLVIFIGLSVLAAEFLWARRLLNRLRAHGAQLGQTLREIWRAGRSRTNRREDLGSSIK
jgi:uncharacterized protein (TIGR02611 family)